MKPSHSRYESIRGLRYHVRCWGPPDAPKLVLLHGWMDMSASFQFMVDAFIQPWCVVAPDWRGFGLSDWSGTDAYWYADYLADLDALLDRLVDEEPALIVGHSMGGNVACLYAGARPERVRGLVNLEGLGLLDTPPEEAPARYARWMDEIKVNQARRDYGSFEELAERLMKEQPRLAADQALFLARHQGRLGDNGRVVVTSDPAHKRANPVLYRSAEVKACLSRITAPVLWVEGAQSEILARFDKAPGELVARKRCIRDLTECTIDEAAHMLHHHQPGAVASAVEGFLTGRGLRQKAG